MPRLMDGLCLQSWPLLSGFGGVPFPPARNKSHPWSFVGICPLPLTSMTAFCGCFGGLGMSRTITHTKLLCFFRFVRTSLPGNSNYFIGNDPKKWRTDVSSYGKVQYKDIYPGISLVYYGSQGRLENDFIVAPGADPRKIRFLFKGAKKLRRSIDSMNVSAMSVARWRCTSER